ncbi:MAG: aminoacyl-tRNA hydrolase [Vampirovibrionales bacterium]
MSRGKGTLTVPDDAPWIIVGLGNYGKTYEHTRHNIGFMALEHIARESGASSWKHDKAHQTLVRVDAFGWEGVSQPVHWLMPQTYMNLSGKALASYLRYYHWHTPAMVSQRVVVLYDEVALPFGKLRVRPKGSHAGHNGLKSLQQECQAVCGQAVDIPRIRLGVGSPDHPAHALKDYVLGQFHAEELRAMPEYLRTAQEALVCLMREGIAQAMNQFNAGDTPG